MQNYQKVGVLALIALVALSLIVMWKSDFLLRQGGYELVGSFQNISGLTVGSDVRYRGMKVGKVMRIDSGLEDIKVYALINKKVDFPSDSYLRVAFDGLVGMKYLNVVPVKSAGVYEPGQLLDGKSTSGIVDFVDIGAQNLQETKAILEVIRSIVDKPEVQNAFINAVLASEKAADQINELTVELRQIAQSIDMIVSDEKFQANFKGIVNETEKTLSSANDFFDNVASLRLKPSGGIMFGTVNNEIRANVDIAPEDSRDYYRMGIGEGPAANQGLSLQDILIARQVGELVGLRIGMINTSLGGGVEYYPNDSMTVSTDLYKINNNPDYPKLRFTSAHEITDFMDITLRADDILNYSTNYSVGVRVKSK